MEVARELALGYSAGGRYAEAVEALEAALAAAPAGSADALALTAELATTARMHPDTVEISAHHGSRLPSGVHGTTSAERCALASLAMHRLVAGAPAAEVAALAGRALAAGMIRQQGTEYHLVYDAMAAMWGTEEVELTTRAHEEAIADARAKGSTLAFARASSFVRTFASVPATCWRRRPMPVPPLKPRIRAGRSPGPG